MHFHWQNLDVNDNGSKFGSGIGHGRWWLDFEMWGLRLCWLLGLRNHHCAFELQVDFVNEKEVTLYIALPILFALWFTVHSRRFPYWDWRRGERTIGVAVFDWKLWVYPWVNDNEWTRQCHPLTWSPLDTFLGSQKHTQRSVSLTDVLVPLPEGNYQATVEMYWSIWTRPRWPFARKILRANIESERGIPVPGKCDSGWDCGEDAIYGLTTAVATPAEAVKALIESATNSRKKYGGEDWKPTSV